jgi:soluble lytic murein transglycosylase-like protein
MTKALVVAAQLGAGALLPILLFALPSRAQIASYTDVHGKIVFTNEDSPRSKTRSSAVNAVGAHTSLDQPSLPARFGPGGISTGSSSPSKERLDRIVEAAAERHKLDPALVKAVINTESAGNPLAVSRKGAIGLMQLIPSTAQRFGVGNPYDPVQNVEGGTTYLKALLDRYNGDLTKSLAAYNAGERAVDVNGGVPPYLETQRYVQKITDAYFRPGSGRITTLWTAPRAPVRREVESDGRVVFTNE